MGTRYSAVLVCTSSCKALRACYSICLLLCDGSKKWVSMWIRRIGEWAILKCKKLYTQWWWVRTARYNITRRVRQVVGIQKYVFFSNDAANVQRRSEIGHPDARASCTSYRLKLLCACNIHLCWCIGTACMFWSYNYLKLLNRRCYSVSALYVARTHLYWILKGNACFALRWKGARELQNAQTRASLPFLACTKVFAGLYEENGVSFMCDHLVHLFLRGKYKIQNGIWKGVKSIYVFHRLLTFHRLILIYSFCPGCSRS